MPQELFIALAEEERMQERMRWVSQGAREVAVLQGQGAVGQGGHDFPQLHRVHFSVTKGSSSCLVHLVHRT